MEDNDQIQASADPGEGDDLQKRDKAINDIKAVDEHFTAGNATPEIATNDGSVIETLDTAFHGTPGWGRVQPDAPRVRGNAAEEIRLQISILS